METGEDLFVYGTLRDPTRVQELLGHPCRTVPARLPGYDRREGRWPYLMRADIAGCLLRGLTAEDLAKLDAYEGVQPEDREGAVRRLYTRELTSVLVEDDRLVPCWIYLPNLADWKPEWL